MRTVTIPTHGGPEVMQIADTPKPAPGPDDILVRVRAAGINRADAIQRQGQYPMPPGVGNILGLELAGEVDSVGANVDEWKPGDKVMGLVAEGAYAEYARMDRGLAVPMPAGWSFAEGGAVIEVFLTAQETVFGLGELKKRETLLVHAGGSGVGTAAIQMAKHQGSTVYFTAGDIGKVERLLALGADAGWNYKTHDFVEMAFNQSKGKGVDVIEDFVGAGAFMRNLSLLKNRGRLVMVGTMGVNIEPFQMNVMMRKRLRILGFTLRAQSVNEKRALIKRFRERWLPALESGAIKPIVHATFPLERVSEAHAMLERNENFGKIVLTVD